MNTRIDGRSLTAAALGAALALIAVAVWPHIPRATAAVAEEQPKESRPSGLLSTSELLIRIEKQGQETNARLTAIEKLISAGLSVRIVEPLPPGLRAPGDSKPDAKSKTPVAPESPSSAKPEERK